MCLLLSASIRRAPVLRRQGTQEKMNWGDLDWWGSDWHLFLDALLHRHLVWLRPGLLPLLFFLWRVHVRMALGDVIASMPLVKQGLFFTCRGGALASLATGVRQCKCVCVCVSINRCQRCPWQAIVAAAAVRGAGATLAGATFFCCVAVYSGYALGFFHPCSSCGEYMSEWHWAT